ncbi:uncharacterized protein LOC110869463 [Helianthus annuus]|uniref:uncharacterized protein LOC110869463 n=1 Tax=Helianthus annuus TaxID=4232 RepID=UPI000B8FF431|nr:uncharacterized protein LOC110869463 [Helianthus annuus]
MNTPPPTSPVPTDPKPEPTDTKIHPRLPYPASKTSSLSFSRWKPDSTLHGANFFAFIAGPFSTISNDLLSTIIRPGNTAYDVWSTLEGLFHDNKNARAIHLMQCFATTRLDGFPNMSAYCQAIKSLADQLANVGAPLDNKRLVLHLLAGLTDQYEGTSTILQ